MSGRGFLPGLIRPVHADPTAWTQTAPVPSALYPQSSIPAPVSALPNPSAAPNYMLPGPGMAYPTQIGSSYPQTYMGPPGLNPYRFPPPTGAFPMGGPPLFPAALAPAAAGSFSNPVEDDDDDDRQISSDGTIAEQLFPPGRIADLDKAITLSVENSFIGKL